MNFRCYIGVILVAIVNGDPRGTREGAVVAEFYYLKCRLEENTHIHKISH
jgi:hypothetical protein